MAETPSTMLPLGTPLPAFTLQDAVSGRAVTQDDVTGDEGLLVMFLCNHCPFVKHVLPELRRLAADAAGRGVGIVAINANDTERYPDDAPPRMKELAEREGWDFPFLLDASQEIAKTFRAACTPDFFLFDADRRLAYRGRLDETRPGRGEPHGADLRAALDAVTAGDPVPEPQQPSVGCNIKWKPGNEPDYFG
ncbi:MAG: thioredoxin family protein [Gemmatimonadota bacterium]|nr:thioredoxin family protein [Gemmatimonadota bacterium]